MDAVFLARIQFAFTIMFHFIFPPLSIGLAWLLVVVEGMGWKKKSEIYLKIGKFFGKLLAITFAVGVASGIVMEFQFGTNWAEYSKFVGDIFGAPLAAEGVFAFFLESGFLGLYLFGRNKVSKGVHWFSILMVAVGSTLSAFWIIVAGSWQQTPAGFVIQNGRAELTNFFEAVFNPSTMVRFSHTMTSAIITGAFFMAGVSAYLIIKKRDIKIAKKGLALGVIAGLIFSILIIFPFGHEHAKQVAETQPAKFAAMEGLYKTQSGAPLILFSFPVDNPPGLIGTIELPKLLSWMAFGDSSKEIKGIDAFPKDELPPLFITFVSFHNMVALGMFFLLLMIWSAFLLYRKKLYTSMKTLKVLLWSIPLPFIAIQLGWIAAEVGRQPWIVYKLLRTSDAASVTVSSGEILFSIIMFSLIYLALGALWLFLLVKEIKHGPEKLTEKEATV
ncbi:MAG: cytochrome ubiquinol oxidase subunit I [Acidobacteriota bacterium]